MPGREGEVAATKTKFSRHRRRVTSLLSFSSTQDVLKRAVKLAWVLSLLGSDSSS